MPRKTVAEKAALKRMLDAARGKTRVYIGSAFERWRRLKELHPKLKNDEMIAEFLLDSYESTDKKPPSSAACLSDRVEVKVEEELDNSNSKQTSAQPVGASTKRHLQQTSLQGLFKSTRTPSNTSPECPSEQEPGVDQSPHLKKPTTSANCADAEPPMKKAKTSVSSDSADKKQPKTQKERDQSRQIRADWFTSFKWLKYDKEKNLFFCTDCITAKKDNLFTKGKSASVPKRDDFTKHAGRKDHLMAAGAKQGNLEMCKGRAKADDQAKESITAAMKTVLWMAQEDVANVKFPSLVDLQLENGANSLRVLEKEDGSFHYSHLVSGLRECLVSVVEEEMLLEIEESGLFSLEADEATDCTNKSVLVVCIRYLGPDGCPKVRFLGVRELEQTTANAITETLYQLLDAKGLNKFSMVGLATDGASVMAGVKNGVSTQFKSEVPFLLSIHCMAHRLQLAAEKAANQVPLIGKYIATLSCFARAIKFSAKLTRTLEMVQKLETGQTKKIKEAFFTRWLSLCDGTQAMAGCIPAVLSALQMAATERTSESRAQLEGLVADIGSYRFIYLTHFLADVVGLLGILSKLMQVATPTYQDLKDAVDNTVCSLLALKEVKGTCGFLEKLDGTFPANAPSTGKTLWEDHYVKDTVKQREQVEKAVDMFLEKLVMQLQSTFPDHDVMTAFDLLQPSVKLSKEDAGKKLDKLLEMYGQDKRKGNVTHTRFVDPDATKKEWQILGPFISKYQTMQELYTYVSHNLEAYPNMGKLLQVALTVTVTSVNCERGVSRYTAIKTSTRSSLRVETIDELIALSLEAPSYKQFRYDLAFNMWHLNRNRRVYRQMLRSAEILGKEDENNNVAVLDKAMEGLFAKGQAFVKKLSKATAAAARAVVPKDRGQEAENTCDD
ncbi:transmembrane protein C17orf113-like [Sphaeramia orbicularis]|uniref:transmembrane protein C17orf113-like n=1 Tax=Sphaeramia orbicularis TaxID=375764 RepID=UPI00117D488A|nr:transmembrane protein C17orf113-like [Sphaeramia orbicularis]